MFDLLDDVRTIANTAKKVGTATKVLTVNRPVKSKGPSLGLPKINSNTSKFKDVSDIPDIIERHKGNNELRSILQEDRKHDWLARQMREEQRILERGDLADLGAAHHKVCAADMLKLYHIGECDADDIDNGEL